MFKEDRFGQSPPCPFNGTMLVGGDCKKAKFFDEAERLCADASMEHTVELAPRMRRWAKLFRYEMHLGFLRLDTLNRMLREIQYHVSNATTPPGEKLIGLICLQEVRCEVVRRMKHI